jgi:hypothetical protein
MDKLKELEDRLSTMVEATAKRDEQNAMDREIIGFLDARIHEYELSVKRLTTEHDELTTELSRVRQDHASKLTVRLNADQRFQQRTLTETDAAAYRLYKIWLAYSQMRRMISTCSSRYHR